MNTVPRFALRALRKLRRFLPENRLGDRIYGYLLFLIHHQRRPKDQPMFNDVLYRIKTTDEILEPLRVLVSDKEYVKLYAKAVVGDKYNVPTLDVIRETSAIDEYQFPPRCCIKPTHASGRVIFRLDGEPVDKEKVKRWFSYNQYRAWHRGANYRTLQPKVIVEPLIFDTANVEDYKIFCFKGVPKLIMVDVDRFTAHTRKFFDTDWNELYFSLTVPRCETSIARPDNLALMLQLAAKLSAPFGFIRIDLYSNGEQCFLGEITNCHGGACSRFIPPEGEVRASRLIFS